MPEPTAAPLALPDGIGDRHLRPAWFFGHHASPLSLLVLGALLAVGLSGAAGGGARTEHGVSNEAGRFSLLAPETSRNGDIFELLFRVEARRPIDRLVIGVEPGLWRRITTNSTVPQAAEERFSRGLIRFSFARLETGESFEFQVQQQINPDQVGTNRGRVVFLDGERPLAQFAAQLRVLP